MAVRVITPTGQQRAAQPQQREEEDFLDKLLKGIGVANQITGVAADISTLKTQGVKRDLLTETREETAREKKALAQGLLTPGQVSKLGLAGKTLTPAQEGTPGAFQLATAGEEGFTPSGQFVTIAQTPKPITPFEQKKLEIEQQKLGALTEANKMKRVEAGVRRISDKFEKGNVAETFNVLTKIDASLKDLGIEKGINSSLMGKSIEGQGIVGKIKPGLIISQPARNLRQSVASLKNALLKARSGGAVTPAEAERLVKEIEGVGTEQELMFALRNVRDVLKTKMQGVLVSVPGESQQVYFEGTGIDMNNPIFEEFQQETLVAERQAPQKDAQQTFLDRLNTELAKRERVAGNTNKVPLRLQLQRPR